MDYFFSKTLLFCLTAIVVLFGCQRKYIVETVFVEPDSTREKIIVGKRLVLSLCGPCHYNSTFQDLSGRPMLDIPRAVGKIYASNITNHPTKGIRLYSAGELKFLLRTGITRDGRLAPFMQKPNLSDEDVSAIIAYLKSDDAFVKASDRSEGKTKYSLLGKAALRHVFGPIPYSNEVKLKPGIYDTIALGKYLIDNNGCYECHSANMIKIDKLFPENSKGYLGGGAKVKNASGKLISTPNITFHETGLNDWTESDLKRALSKGVSPTGRVLTYPMPIYSYLSDEEIVAIYRYLKTVPEIKRGKKNVRTHRSEKVMNGKTTYEKYQCNNCHGATGKGIADLTNAYIKYSRAEIQRKIEEPSKGVAMPSFKGVIKQEELNLLVDYIVELGKDSQKFSSN
jgi:mono/diheme cytochrome c family protein